MASIGYNDAAIGAEFAWYTLGNGGAVKDHPDASKQHSPPGAVNAPDVQPDTRKLPSHSDRYERDSSPRFGGLVADSTLPPPQSIVNDKYRIDVELGRGGMGAVYRAHHVELLKPVALKWLLPEFASDPDSRQRFGREARAASNIKHENVVDVYDFGIDAERGVPYIVMELLTGVSLSAYLEQRGRLDAREALAIVIACMRGVAAAHKLGIVHRDLKPENIFLSEGDDPGSWRVKVLDFGVAAALEARPDDTTKPIITRTTSRNIVGTVFYMPAEQLAGGAVDERADIYSLGVILYEMLSGKPPYYGKSLNDVTSAILDGNAAPLDDVLPSFDPALAALVTRAMAPRKPDRFASMAEMIQAFQRYAQELSSGYRVDASGPVATARARVPAGVPRNARGWTIAAVVSVVLAGLMFWGAYQLRTQQGERLLGPAPETVMPQLRPRPEEPAPAIEPPPPAEHSTSAVTDPTPPSKAQPAPPEPPTVPTGVSDESAKKPAAAKRELEPRQRRRVTKKREPAAAASPKAAPPTVPQPDPSAVERQPPVEKQPARAAPVKPPPPRIRYAEPW